MSGAPSASEAGRVWGSSTTRWARGLATALAVLGAVGVACHHEAREGARAMAASDAALSAKNPELAIAEAYLAATRVAPLSPWSERGYGRLQSIAEDAEARGDDELAETAWHAVRAAETSTAGPFTGDSGRRRRAELALGRIDARRLLVLAARTPGLARADEAALARAHGRDPTPTPLTLAALGLAATLFAAAAATLVHAGFTGGRRSLLAAGGAAVGAAAMALALSR